MGRMKSDGMCAYCKGTVKKDSRSILSHLARCKAAGPGEGVKKSDYMILLLSGTYARGYWLVIKARAEATLGALDRFIKDIWVECCGHISQFSYKYAEFSKQRQLWQVFQNRFRIDYVYDLGSSTDITVSLLKEAEAADGEDIVVLFRNKEPEYTCSYCENAAFALCPFCAEDGAGLLCTSCIHEHRCAKENGEDMMSPLVNSPRCGVCGYTGPVEKRIKRYFPRGII